MHIGLVCYAFGGSLLQQLIDCLGWHFSSICKWNSTHEVVLRFFLILFYPSMTEQHWIDLTEKLEYQRPRKIQEAKRELEETKARCLPLLAQLEERGASILKTEVQVCIC